MNESELQPTALRCDLPGADVIAGWSIPLTGWQHLNREILECLWSKKIRKELLRPCGVDAVALFYFDSDDQPKSMQLIPEVSCIEHKSIAFADYTKKLASILAHQALRQFTYLLTKAQEYYSEGKTTEEIIQLLLSEDVVEAMVMDNQQLSPEERVALYRQVRRETQARYKQAVKEREEAQRNAELALAEAEKAESFAGIGKRPAAPHVVAEKRLAAKRAQQYAERKKRTAERAKQYYLRVKQLLRCAPTGPTRAEDSSSTSEEIAQTAIAELIIGEASSS